MKARISIRRAVPTDSTALSGLIRRNAEAVLASDYTPQQLTAWKRYNTPAQVRQRLGQRRTFCAVRSGRICGTVALKGDELVGLYVSPRWRGCGIGRMLLDHLEGVAAKQGINRLHLTSTPSAVTFYEHHGWKSGRKVVLNILEVDFEETAMTKDLRSLPKR